MGIKRWTKSKLISFVAEWQKILRLQDWIVEIKYDESIDSTAQVRYNAEAMHAVIRLNPKLVWKMEKHIVHELLHLKFPCCDYEPDTVGYYTFEQGIDTLAQALVKLKGDKR